MRRICSYFSQKRDQLIKRFHKNDTSNSKSCTVTLEPSLEESSRIKMKFDDSIILVLDNGKWKLEETAISDKAAKLEFENQRLITELEQAQQEKDELMNKFEILLDICGEHVAENRLKDREIDKLQAIIESRFN